jgi:hypothetical protein
MQIALLAVIGLVVFQDTRAAECMECATLSTIRSSGPDPSTLITNIGDLGNPLAYTDKCPQEDKTGCAFGTYCVAVNQMVTWTDADGDNSVTQLIEVMGCQIDVLVKLSDVYQALTEADEALNWSSDGFNVSTCENIKADMCTDLDKALNDGTIQTAESECTVVCGDWETFKVNSRIQTVGFEMTYTTYVDADAYYHVEDMNAACMDIEGFLHSSLESVVGCSELIGNEADATIFTFKYELYFTDAVVVNEDAVIAAVEGIVRADVGDEAKGAAFESSTGIEVVMSEQQVADAEANKDGAARNAVTSFAVLATALIAAL